MFTSPPPGVAGAMMAHSVGVELEAKVQGGLMKGLKRSILGGESLFMTTWTAPDQGGWVDVAANLPGDLAVLEVNGDMNVTQGGWLASSIGIELDTKWGGFKNVFGDEGGFLVHCSGSGKIVVACYGAIERIDLGAGEKVVLDSGHLVAFDPSVGFITRKVTKGIMQTLKSGEGFVTGVHRPRPRPRPDPQPAGPGRLADRGPPLQPRELAARRVSTAARSRPGAARRG